MARVTIDLPDYTHFTTYLSVRITEINYGGHLSNDAVLAIAHEARIRFLNHFAFSEFDIGGCAIIMADAAVVYRSEGFLGNELRVDVCVGEASSSGFELFYRIHNMTTGKDLAHVKTGILSYDYDNRKIRRLPEHFMETITKEKSWI